MSVGVSSLLPSVNPKSSSNSPHYTTSPWRSPKVNPSQASSISQVPTAWKVYAPPFPDQWKRFSAISKEGGLIKALTTDAETFYQQCDPDKDNLCLHGLPNETWKINLPVEEVPPELPEPALGINFARDGMQENDWLLLVAVHCDSWLLSVAFYFGARFGFGRSERKKLFQMINDLPTVFEVVSRNIRQPKDQGASNYIGNKSKYVARQSYQSELQTTVGAKSLPSPEETGCDEENEDDDQGAICGACGDNSGADEFWICCDVCEVWFHGKCVKITPAKAEHIKHYKCPGCSNKKPRI